MPEWLKSVAARMRVLVRRRQLEQDFEDEVAFHLAMREEQIRERDLDRAHVRARRLFGSSTKAVEELRRVWSVSPILGACVRDLRHAVRALVHNPTYAGITIITLAVAIGVNTAMFSVLNAVLLRPLPYANPDRLVTLATKQVAEEAPAGRSAYRTIEAWRHLQSFEDIAFSDPAAAVFVGDGGAERISLNRISPNFFTLLGVRLVQGRSFTWEEAEAQQRVALISQRFWRQHLVARATVVGTSILLDGRPSTIIGVLPARFDSREDEVDVWEPYTLSPDWNAARNARGYGSWFVIGRLRSGVGIERAQAEATTVFDALDGQRRDDQRFVATVMPLGGVDSRSKLVLWLLAGAVFSVLLLATTNVISLSLTRIANREREFAVRAALGASRAQIVTQTLVESFVLSLVSAALGAGIAAAGLRIVMAISPGNVPGLEDVRLDWPVLAAAMACGVFATIVSGLAPGIIAARQSRDLAHRVGSRGVAGSNTRRIRQFLIGLEFAMASVLLVAAGLLLRSLAAMQHVEPGFRADRVLSVQLATDALRTPESRVDFYTRVLEQVNAVRGVEATGVIGDFVIGGDAAQVVMLEGDDTPVQIRFRRDEVSPGFFETVRSPILEGRPFSTADGPTAPRVVVLSQSMARRLWPAGDAVGQRFKIGTDTSPWFTVVGVVVDMRRQSPEVPAVFQMFEPLAQNPGRLAVLLVRTASTDPASMTGAVRAAVRRVDSLVPVYGVATLEERFGSFLVLRQFQTWLISSFAVVALLLAAIGIYGLVYWSVALRRKEIAIRMAIGGRAPAIVQMVMSEGLILASSGTSVGLAGALALSHVGASLLFGITATDLVTFITVATLLIGVALAACYIPARRAVNISPLVALRQTQ